MKFVVYQPDDSSRHVVRLRIIMADTAHYKGFYLLSYLLTGVLMCLDSDEPGINAISLHLYNPHHFTLFRLGNSSTF